MITVILASIGAALILTQSFLFAKLRRYMLKYEYAGKLVSCLQCSSFWCGLIFGLIYGLGFTTAFFIACIASGICFFLELLLERL